MPGDKQDLHAALEQAIRLGFEREDHALTKILDGQMAPLVEELHATVKRLANGQGKEERWLYYRLPVTSSSANTMIGELVRPCLERLTESLGILGWWWLNKVDLCGYAIRLRICCTGQVYREVDHVVSAYFDTAGLQIAKLHYEPELRLFGGSNGISLAHRYFHADSDFLSKWIRDFGCSIPLGLSTALLIHLFTAVGMDIFECWDVFDRVAKKRPPSKADVTAGEKLRPILRSLIRTPPQQIFLLYPDSQRQAISQHQRALSVLGQELSRYNCAGQLEIGPREFLMPVVLFHWNRLGLSAALQKAIGHGLCQELAAISHEGSADKSLVEAVG